MPAAYMHCLIRIARFKGIHKHEFIDSKRVFGNIFQLIEAAEDFIKRHTAISGRIEPDTFQRVDEPEYSYTAMREAILNAICHRDYTHTNGSISLAIYDDRIEITSPGGLPNGMRLDDLMQTHDSKPRNKVIANVLYRRGMIETFGMGTQKMLSECKAEAMRVPDFIERGTTFVVRFWSKNTIGSHVGDLTLSLRQQEIINLLAEHQSLAVRELKAFLSTDIAERTLRDELTKMRNMNLISSHGRGRGAIWYKSKPE